MRLAGTGVVVVLISFSHLASANAAAVEAPSVGIVVEGRDPARLREQVKACEATDCSSAEYANRVLAAANGAFVAGDYTNARALLTTAVRRLDARHAPAEFRSAIFDALSIVAEHQGDRRDAAGATARMIYALQHTPTTSRAAEISRRIALGDLQLRRGDVVGARRAYHEAGKLSDEIGSHDLRAAVDIHDAVADYATGARRRALHRLRAIATSSTPVAPDIRLAAAVYANRLAKDGGERSSPDAMPTDLAQASDQAEPVVLEEPRAQPKPAAFFDAPGVRGLIQWADIGFWIRPNGYVEDAKVLRSSAAQDWAKFALGRVSHRRYVPFPDDDQRGRYFVSRLTLGYPEEVATGTQMKVRTGEATISELLLAREDWPSIAVNEATSPRSDDAGNP